jgi:hypothetical protein
VDGAKNSTGDTSICKVPTILPQPPNGITKFCEYLSKSIHVVGKESFGRIVIKMVIEKDGSISHIQAQKTNNVLS